MWFMNSSVQLSITSSEHSDKVTILQIAGELDSSTIEEVNNNIDEIISRHPPFVIADMAQVTYFSSSALGGLMGCRKRLSEVNGDLVFAGLTLDIKTKLSLLGATAVFKIYNNSIGAINAYNWEYECGSQQLNLEFPSLLSFVPPVRQLVSRIAKQKGYSNRDSFRIETIVDEVCNNAVEHGVQGSEHEIQLYVKIDRSKIELKVVNSSDPEKVAELEKLSKSILKAPVPNLEQKRGRGLALIKMLSNDLKIDLSETGTSIHVTRLRGD
ncbi:MAG: STAS domain-containing protein [Chitinivibrionales bacterium]|nr:STAS domain-containing protein [Chitinivibrionales bacterium]